jgi:hypothetical protein
MSESDRGILLYALGPQILLYPECSQEGGQVDATISTSGILMGLPLTWVTLNLLQFFWIDQSAIDVGETPTYGNFDEPVRVCGDDLVAHWTDRRTKAYERLVT